MNSIEYSVDSDVAVIRLNRPEKFNSFNREMSLQLQDALDRCLADNVRSVYLTGNGKGFSAGQDITELTGDDPIDFKKILSEHFNPIITKIRELPLPVVCGVNGVAAGAGANIALCCDVVIASRNASFIQAFSKIGLIPDSGGTYFLPRLVGFQKASAFMMLGDKINAEEAEKTGMVYKVIDEVDFDEKVFEVALQLASMPTQGLAFTKQALNYSFGRHYKDQLTKEDELQLQAGNTDDYREGIASFIEKRKPKFSGR